jgi:glycosyltransferase involved in cell wall biosynthesis
VEVPVKVWIELPEENDVDAHARAHDEDAIADRTPYGLHHLADADDVTVAFRRPLRDPRLALLARKVRNRLDAHEAVAGAFSAFSAERRQSDVVLCMDERTGVPAALAPVGPPVVSAINWIGHPETYRRATRAVLGRALRRMAAVVVDTEGVIDEMVDGWGLDPARVAYARFGIDPDFFPPQPWTEGTSTIASVGDDPFRDHALLIDAVRRLRARGSDARLELGTTMPDIDIPSEVGVLHRRRMEGAVRAMYQRSGVVGVATVASNRGTGSTVILEAAASARPVVVTATPATERLVKHGERGLLVPPDDPEAFADALETVLADPERARVMGASAREWLERERTTAHMADDLRTVLRRAVEQGRPR